MKKDKTKDAMADRIIRIKNNKCPCKFCRKGDYFNLWYVSDTDACEFELYRDNHNLMINNVATFHAVKNGHLLLLQFLINNGYDIYYDSCLMLTNAAIYKQEEVMKYIIGSIREYESVSGRGSER